MRTILLGSSAVIGLLLFGVFLNTGVSAQSPTQGAHVDKVRFIQYLDDNVALQEMKSGTLDTYFFRIPLEAVSEFRTLSQNAESPPPAALEIEHPVRPILVPDHAPVERIGSGSYGEVWLARTARLPRRSRAAPRASARRTSGSWCRAR